METVAIISKHDSKDDFEVYFPCGLLTGDNQKRFEEFLLSIGCDSYGSSTRGSYNDILDELTF